MTLKKVAILGTILVALIVFIVAINYRTEKKTPEEAKLSFKDFQEKNCSEIFLIERLDTARLKRNGRIWNLVTPCIPIFYASANFPRDTFFSEYPVDSALSAKALETIGKLKCEELMSINPEKQTEMEVDRRNALVVECWDSAGVSLGEIYIGVGGGQTGSCFMRMNNSDSVYVVGGSIRSALFANPKRWADKSIVKFDKNLPRRITIISADNDTIVMEKRESALSSYTGLRDEWHIIKPMQAKANRLRVESLISDMSNLHAADFEGDRKLSEKDMGFMRPATITTVALSNGEFKTVIIGSKEKGAMKWVRNPEKPNVTFTVYSFTLAGFNFGMAHYKDTLARDSLSPVEAAKSVIEKQIESSIKGAK
jgi:hypothetical protein